MLSRIISMTELMSAVEDYKLDRIKYSISRYGLPNNSQKLNDYMVLQKALTIRHKEIAKLLIEAGCRVKANKSDSGWSPLALAIIMEDMEIASMLIQKYATISAGNGLTVLHVAAQKNLPVMAEFLLKKKVNINVQNTVGKTALQTLLEEDHIYRTYVEQKLNNANKAEMIKFLITRGARYDLVSSNGENPLHHAVRMTRLDIVCLFMQLGQLVNQQNENGNTPLHILLQGNYKKEDEILEISKVLIKGGAKVDIQNKCKHVALHIATKRKFYQVLKIFLTCNCNMNICNDTNDTILHVLLKTILYSKKPSEQEKEILRILLKRGARIDIKNVHGLSAMDLAFDTKQIDVLSWFLQNIQDLNSVRVYNESMLHRLIQENSDTDQTIAVAKFLLDERINVDILNDQGKTPLHIACLKRQVNMAKILISYKADVNAQDKNGSSILQTLVATNSRAITQATCQIAKILLTAKAVVEDNKTSGLHILHCISREGQNQILSVLLEFITYVDVCDSDDNTIMHNLLKIPRNMDDEEEKECANTVALLISRGANFEIRNKNGETPLHLAIKYKHEQVFHFLLENGANPMILDNQGNNALHLLCLIKLEPYHALQLIEQEMFQRLIKYGFEINSVNKVDKTPLILAVKFGCIDIVKALIEMGADMNYSIKNSGFTPLLMAAALNRNNIVRFLIESGADVNSMNRNYRTALHYAVHRSNVLTYYLLHNGIDAEIQDDCGRTALHIAAEGTICNIVSLLLIHGADLNVKNLSGLTPLMIVDKTNKKVWNKLMQHAYKLRTARLFLCVENDQLIRKNEDEFSYYRRTVAAEFRKLKNVLIDRRVCLSDVLRMNINKLSFYKNNETFKKIINDVEFVKRFPNYADLIQACYHRGSVRNDLLISAKNVLRDVTSIPIPDICCEYIFNFLTNQDLHIFKKAFESKTLRRKVLVQKANDQVVNDQVPAKKVRVKK